MKDLSKPFASLLSLRVAPRIIRAGARFHLALLRRFPRAGIVGGDTLVLTTRGRTTGQPRATPLYYVRREERVYVAASFAGRDTPPNWYLNLLADPRVVVEISGTRADCLARVLSQQEAERVWPLLLSVYRPFARYRRRARRQIPVIELARSAPTPPTGPDTTGRGTIVPEPLP